MEIKKKEDQFNFFFAISPFFTHKFVLSPCRVKTGADHYALCVVASSHFVPDARDAAWFYRLLSPSPQ